MLSYHSLLFLLELDVKLTRREGPRMSQGSRARPYASVHRVWLNLCRLRRRELW